MNGKVSPSSKATEPSERTLRNLLLRVVPELGDEGEDAGVGVNLGDGLRVRPNGLHEADGVRVDAFGVLRDVADRMRDLEAEPEEVANLLEEGDDLRVEVDRELERAALRAVLGDLEKATRDLHAPTVDVVEPGLVDRPRVELAAERLAFALELLALGIELPAFAEDVLDSLHVGEELAFDLLRPDDGAGDGRVVAELRHVVGLRVLVRLLELVVKEANVLLDRVDELRLVLGDGACTTNL